MKFVADFHIHSHFSLATSGLLTPEHLDRWGRIKGIKVLGTGDFTHPGWLAELREKLMPAEPGLFGLKREFMTKPDWSVPETEENSVRFLLTAEVSCIYKKDGRVRKVHNVIFAPDFETAEKIQRKLKALDFNITSDGRPILGMDSRDLLELALDASPGIFFVPAHIWTPWFSALGDKSGFDRIDECYADLSNHIHAVESGLSSDPAMNDLCSHLDRYSLISNSDAHSPEKLGREANRFDTELAYDAITSALRAPDPARFLETLEFFPQEGKYHLDGHRKCGISWEPEETLRRNAVCPVCGKRITVGVLHRVHRLSDRVRPDEKADRRRFRSLIPLVEILSEIRGSGRSSRSVVHDYAVLVQRLGSEIAVLLDCPIDEIRGAGGETAAEAVRRMRAGEVLIEAGYDGEYGRIRVFGEGEVERKSQTGLFAGGGSAAQPIEPAGGIVRSEKIPRKGAGSAGPVPGEIPAQGPDRRPVEISMAAEPRTSTPAGIAPGALRTPGREPPEAGPVGGMITPASSGGRRSRGNETFDAICGGGTLGPLDLSEADVSRPPSVILQSELLTARLNPEQRAAAEHAEGHAMILAGPGTGKTAALARRVAVLLGRGVTTDRILTITFTNRAAEEVLARLSATPGCGPSRSGGTLTVRTFHSFGHSLLRAHSSLLGRGEDFTVFDEDEKRELLKSIVPKGMNVRQAAERIRRIKQDPAAAEPSPEIVRLLDRYESLLGIENGFDFDDLIAKPLQLLRTRPEVLRDLRGRFRHILLDEFQDLDGAQYETVRLFAGGGSAVPTADLWAVGDPDQSIYGFRGASPVFIHRFLEDFPGTTVYHFVQSYRCTDAILMASGQMIRGSGFGIRDSGKTEFGDRNLSPSPLTSHLLPHTHHPLPITYDHFFYSKPETRSSKPVQAALRGTGAGVKIQIVEHPTEASEAEFVARTIESMSGGLRFFSMDSGVTTGHDDSELALSDFAVLCRIGKQMDAFEKAFRDHGIPYHKSDTEPFYRREPVRSVVAVLKKAVRTVQVGNRDSGFGIREAGLKLKAADSASDDGNDPSMRESVGKETVRTLLESIIASAPAAADPGLRLEIEELLELAEPFERDVNGFIRSLSLGTGMDLVRPGIQAAALTTLHAAKGLEFSCVFIPGCEDGLLPYRLHGRTDCDIEEERRLLYVGMTRARRFLFLSHAGKRILFGRELNLPQSPFLGAIEESLVERGSPKFGRRKSRDRQMDLF